MMHNYRFDRNIIETSGVILLPTLSVGTEFDVVIRSLTQMLIVAKGLFVGLPSEHLYPYLSKDVSE